LNIVAKFPKDSIFRVDIFAKLSMKYWQNFGAATLKKMAMDQRIIYSPKYLNVLHNLHQLQRTMFNINI